MIMNIFIKLLWIHLLRIESLLCSINRHLSLLKLLVPLCRHKSSYFSFGRFMIPIIIGIIEQWIPRSFFFITFNYNFIIKNLKVDKFIKRITFLSFVIHKQKCLVWIVYFFKYLWFLFYLAGIDWKLMEPLVLCIDIRDETWSECWKYFLQIFFCFFLNSIKPFIFKWWITAINLFFFHVFIDLVGVSSCFWFFHFIILQLFVNFTLYRSKVHEVASHCNWLYCWAFFIYSINCIIVYN